MVTSSLLSSSKVEAGKARPNKQTKQEEEWWGRWGLGGSLWKCQTEAANVDLVSP